MSTIITKPTTPISTASAAAAQATATPSTVTALKKSGPPVPPRPQHTLPASSLLKAQRESSNRLNTTSSVANTKVTVATPTATAMATATAKAPVTKDDSQPVLQRKSSEVVGSSVGGVVGRTIIYKSPSINLEKRHEGHERRPSGATTNLSRAMSAPKPPLKLRKAPDVPAPKPAPTVTESTSTSTSKSESETASNRVDNIVIVQSSNGVTLSRHNSMNIQKCTGIKDTRLSLGRADFEKNISMNLEQLKPSQPLPRPRKIVKVPVATLDIEEDSNVATHTNIFRRSKTTLDNLASRANITTISTVNASNSFLGGKTVEIKNNLKNAAERLFSEIIVNQQKQVTEPAKMITKHERAIQHQALLEQELSQEQQKRLQQNGSTSTKHPQCLITGQNNVVTVVTTMQNSTPIANTPSGNNCTRININTTNNQTTTKPTQNNDVTLDRTEKKIAFHEMLISELAAMRTKSSSMEQLSTKSFNSQLAEKTSTTSQQITVASTTSSKQVSPFRHSNKPVEKNGIVVDDVDLEDVDADNVEDVEGDIDDDDFSKRLKVGANSTSRRRCPSGCSSDSSPYGTERSSRIRTADWIEVNDNGKKVTMSSCHISLEDSGLEDEERLDEMSSSGVGDSWDSVKEVENEKRTRSVQRAMSIADLPPLPKSLSGFNKMLGSDSGLLSDNDTKMDSNSNNPDSVKDSNCLNTTDSSSSSIHNNIDEQRNDKNDKNDNDNNHNNNNDNNNDSGIDTSMSQELKESDNEKQFSNTATGNENATATATAAAAAGTTLDIQLATLKKEMFGLRQLDLSLLSQLWALNDSIQEFRTILQEQEQEQESYSPHSPTPSSYDSVSSDGEDVIISNKMKIEAKPKIITTQPKLMKSNSTENSNVISSPTNSPRIEAINASIGQQQQQHFAKPPAPLPKPQVMPVPRMRSAPPPPPIKSTAPSRPT